MKNLLSLISLSSILLCHAQIETSATIETNTGFEHNIFKFPNTYVDSDGNTITGSDALASSFYQRFYARLAAKRTWRKSELSLSFSPQARVYYSESDASYSEFFTKLQYDYDLREHTKLRTAIWYRLKDREGLNADASDLAFPLGYTHYGIYSRLDFRLHENNRSQLRISFNSKNYDATQTSELSYNAFAGKYAFKNIFKRRMGYHHYGFELNYNTKAFTRIQNSGTDNFTWQDASVQLFYKYPISKPIDIKAMLAYKIRKDNNDDAFSFKEISPALHLRYNTKSWDANFTTSYTLRNYDTIEATNSNDEFLGELEYKYIRFNLNIEKEINDKWTVFLNGNFTNRNSNRTNINSVFFRSYDYSDVSLGVKFRF
ncbi:MAG: hypothetical protein ED556_00215 [Winogradskyella sp.]|uniref:hypothetical protein n=1 Tax=Winogradskyella sp. TaxID=1883156 RepID=UPI000F3B272D|nr:hypothetical protein [Winogradskyella sp.]RNC87651.1 MAG: hypothetical protein ED556_00215 [Winogradskyella sp.]